VVVGNNTFVSDYGSSSFKTPGNDTSVYAIGDLMGTAVEMLNIFASAGGTGLLVGVTVIDAIKTKPDLDILIFSSNPNLTSTNNAPFALATSDLRTLQARIPIRLGHWSDLNSQSIAVVPVAGTAPHAGAQWVQGFGTSTSLFVAVEIQTTSTFTATNTIEIKLAVVE
jgi:hypothetical protein